MKVYSFYPISEGVFLKRDNRFLITAKLDGKEVKAHLRDPGRLKELLIPGNRVLLQKTEKPERKTKYEVVAFFDGNTPVIVNSGIHSRIAENIIPVLMNCTVIKKEIQFLDSRIDFLAKCEKDTLIEVKGCTLVRNGMALFPDAPTERGLRHLKDLIRALEIGWDAKVLFLVMRPDADVLKPNKETHPEFADMFAKAIDAGVKAIAATFRLEIEGETGNVYFDRVIRVEKA